MLILVVICYSPAFLPEHLEHEIAALLKNLMPFDLMIKMVRTKLGLSQEQLARALNISFSTVNRWENGKSNPSPMAKELFYNFCTKNEIDIETIKKGDGVNG